MLERPAPGSASRLSGDPCIVWDDAINGWRMIFFRWPPGHGQAVCLDRADLGPGDWKYEGRLLVTNPGAVGFFDKPFVVMDPGGVDRGAPPSLGGFAWCEEAWPVRGWPFYPKLIEWAKDVPPTALEAGEGYNLWRQFIHVRPDGGADLFYNSGFYGRERLYLKEGRWVRGAGSARPRPAFSYD